MARCERCGNDYDKAFQVMMAGKSHTFDSFECAIQSLAPTCAHCSTRIIGHGLEKDGLVARTSCDSDKRGTFVALTDEGLARLAIAERSEEGRRQRVTDEEHRRGQTADGLVEVDARHRVAHRREDGRDDEPIDVVEEVQQREQREDRYR